eukprot:TRINITY_DN4621_c0_g1_i1.p2 TRINITY_DN4621_c0_g1~~TRINITY_DN4621_c0_g1_i1.p2  ORF type:complete len:80 (-),score=11.27 TRINITY_DN4621_c0_g1_i1:305-544(-)
MANNNETEFAGESFEPFKTESFSINLLAVRFTLISSLFPNITLILKLVSFPDIARSVFASTIVPSFLFCEITTNILSVK